MTQQYKRRRKLIKARLQLSLSGIFAGVSVLACLLMCLMFSSLMSDAATRMPQGGEFLTDLLPGMMIKALLVVAVAVLPLTVAVGVLATFRVAGPVYRIEKYLKSVVRGEADAPCRIRKGDHLHDLCDLVNEATAPLRVTPPGDGEETGEERRAAA